MPVKCLGCFQPFDDWRGLREHDCPAPEYRGGVWRHELEPETGRVEVTVGGML